MGTLIGQPLSRTKEYRQAWREKNRDKVNAYHRKYVKEHPEEAKASRKKYGLSHPEYFKKKAAARRARFPHYDSKRNREIRLAVLIAYGNKCKCCDEVTLEFLALDHVEGRKSGHEIDKLKGSKLYRWLYFHNCPQDVGIQILCHNCNSSFGFYGYCPHHPEIRRENYNANLRLGI